MSTEVKNDDGVDEKAEKVEEKNKDILQIDPILGDDLPEEIMNMWEIPQIYEFLCLTKDLLHINSLSMYEMERMLTMPEASKQLSNVMTCLLSPLLPRSKLKPVPPMPYKLWTNYLMKQKLTNWFKIYENKDNDSIKVLDSIGIEPEFWKIFSNNILIDNDFEKLNLKQRVWLLKTICDTLMHSKKSLQDEISYKYLNGESEKILGKDRYGARYIYFPIFLNNDLRIYKHSLNNNKILVNNQLIKPSKILITKKTNDIINNNNNNNNTNDVNGVKKKIIKRRRERKRKSRWKNGNLPLKPKKRVKVTNNNLLTCDIKKEKLNNDDAEDEDDEDNNDNESNNSINLNIKLENNDKVKCEVDEQNGADDVGSNSSKTDDEKLNEKIYNGKTTTTKSNNLHSKSDDEKLIEQDHSDNVNKYTLDNEDKLDELLNDNSRDSFPSISVEKKAKLRKNLDNFQKILTDLGVSTFQLVVNSVESLNNLITKLETDKTVTNNKSIQTETMLINNIKDLIETLKPKEQILNESAVKARLKLQEEWDGLKHSDTTVDPSADDSSSNRWILGSQGPLFVCGDTMLARPEEDEKEKGDKDDENTTKDDSTETRRVLRARGVSSYIESFTSDDEESFDDDNNNVNGEAECDPLVSTTEDTGNEGQKIPQSPLKLRLMNDESEYTDSDQDWTLPSSRKRRSRRSAPNKRLRNLQNKLQHLNKLNSEPKMPIITSISGNNLTIEKIPNRNYSNSLDSIKIENVHSELDIKEEDVGMNEKSNSDLLKNDGGITQQSYLLVNTGNTPVNYVVMPPENSTFTQSTPVVSVNVNSQVTQALPQHQVPIQQGYYIQPNHSTGYLMTNPNHHIRPTSFTQSTTLQPMIIHQGHQPQQYLQQPPVPPPLNYYSPHRQLGVVPPPSIYSNHHPPQIQQTPSGHSHVLPHPPPQHLSYVNPPIRIPNQLKVPPRVVENRPVLLRHPRLPHAVGAVIRSTVPFKSIRPGAPKAQQVKKASPVKKPNERAIKPKPAGTNDPTAKTTSLIVLSDSDDEIEMIIMEKNGKVDPKQKTRKVSKCSKTLKAAGGGVVASTTPTTPTTTAATAATAASNANRGGNINENIISPQIMERMSQGGISITPVKSKTTAKPMASSTQLVVVVNETGSHYALALPNGSKLILTPEQVAQIRASNNGNLVL